MVSVNMTKKEHIFYYEESDGNLAVIEPSKSVLTT